MKKGDSVKTPDGEGTIHNFEINPPVHTRQPSFYADLYDASTIQEIGFYIRVGVKGTNHRLDVAYYPLKTILRLNS